MLTPKVDCRGSQWLPMLMDFTLIPVLKPEKNLLGAVLGIGGIFCLLNVSCNLNEVLEIRLIPHDMFETNIVFDYTKSQNSMFLCA